MSEPKDLVLLTKAQRALAQANTIDEVKEIRDKSAAVKAYAQKARLGKHLVMEAAAVRIRAERRLGQMLRKTPLADSAPGNQYTEPGAAPFPDTVLLKDLGITKNESSRGQRIAELPEAAFEQYLADCVQAQREPNFAGLLRLARAGTESPAVDQADEQDPSVASAELPFPEAQCATLLAIPPWHGCHPHGQSPLTTDQLCQLAVGRLCQQQAHLYLWTGSRYLLDGLDLIDAWGFTYETALVAVYEQVRPEMPWPDAHHLLLLGTRGDLPFGENDTPARSWLPCKRLEDGLIPQQIRDLIEATSPGPYGQVFGSESGPSPDWTLCPTPTV